jgi:diketogulonate reductase-like aldo/keto reductase
MQMTTRPIPSTKEALPVVGCGTWIGFDQRPGTDEYRRLPGVLDALFAAGGTVIDSSPMYGRSEETTGELAGCESTRPSPSSPPRSGPRAARPASRRWSSRSRACAPKRST